MSRCPQCDRAIAIFWTREEVEGEEEGYDKALREMSYLVSVFPPAHREVHESYKWRMRLIFQDRHQLALVDARLKHPLTEATVKALNDGVHFLVALSRARHVEPSKDRDVLEVPGRKKRSDLDYKPLRPKAESKVVKKIRL